jgi:RNA polymerase sigma factor (sigma-70 family)
MSRLNEKIALITGGTSGIGLATAQLFRQEGAQVAIIGQSQERLDLASKTLGTAVLAMRADTRSLTNLDIVMNRIKKQWGRLDILFVNAGTIAFRPLLDIDETSVWSPVWEGFMNSLDDFNYHRPLLFGIAYRMLGTVADAEDMVQETFLRWQQATDETVSSVKTYLATIITRLCIDYLRSARVRREQYVGTWLPEPLFTQPSLTATDLMELAESLSIAFLTVLERLSPIERAVFLLRDVFDYDYDEISLMVGKSPTNCRQILKRAKQHLATQRPRFPVSPSQQEQIATQFLNASTPGDLEDLLLLLATDVTDRSDGEGQVVAALKPILGATKVARMLLVVNRIRILAFLFFRSKVMNHNLSADEQTAATDTILNIDRQVQAQKGPDLRKDHSKSHGLVWGEFMIEDNLPDSLKVGIFAQPQIYPIWARFSNASDAEKRGKLKSDLEPDIRAVAIKLLEVEGEKVIDDESETQDFLLLNHPVFLVRDAQGFATLTKATVGKADEEELRSLAPTFEILQAISSKKVANPLLIQYWSTTPYQLGSQSIKYSIKPHQPEAAMTVPDIENYLRVAMVDYLSANSQDATFDFLVQLYVDEEKTPIENPMQEWPEADSPFIKLATIKIPAQKFDFDERKRLDEGLSFNPWHSLPAHAPLGSVNLARKHVYQEMAKARRGYSQHRSEQPQPHSLVADDPQ